MSKIDKRFLEMKEIQELLEISEEEEKSLSDYQGDSTEINELLGVYLTDSPVIAEGRDYYFTQDGDPNPRLQIYMKMIEDIYLAMVKNAYLDIYGLSIKTHRGSAHSLLNREYQSFISSSSDYNEAALFAVSNNRGKSTHIVSNLYVSKDVPVYCMDLKGNEHEVLISPFVEVTKNEAGYYGAVYSGEAFGQKVRIENLNVKKKELSRLSIEEQEKLQDELMVSSQEMLEAITTYYKSQKDYYNMQDKLEIKENAKRNVLDEDMKIIAEARRSGNYDRESKFLDEKREDTKYFDKIINELEQQISQLKLENENAKKTVLEWRKKFRMLVEARCADKELELENKIHKIINPILQKEEAERKAKEEKRIKEKEEAKIRFENGLKDGKAFSNQLEGIIDSISENASYQSLLRKQDRLDNAGFRSNSLITQLRVIIDSIGNEVPIDYLSEEGKRELTSPYNNGMTFMDRIVNLEQAIEKNAPAISSIVDNECKRMVMKNVLKIRAVQEGRKLLETRNQVANEKLGLFGGNKKRQEERRNNLEQIDQGLAQIKEFINNLSNYDLNNTKEYSARTIMAELQIALEDGTNVEERALLEGLKQKMNSVFKIDENGIAKRYQEAKEQYSKPNGPITFINKYDGMVNKRMQQPVNHPLVSEARVIHSELDDVLNLSDKEYVRNNRNYSMPFKPMERD